MKYRISILLASLFVFAGCMTEDGSNCPKKDNVKLGFSLKDVGRNEVFVGTINKVDLYIFDENDKYLGHHQVNQAQLNKEQSVTLSLEPGEYRIVSWGNIDSKCKIDGLPATRALSRVEVTNVSDKSGDPVYYGNNVGNRTGGPFMLSVPERGKIEETVNFFHLHKTVQVFVQNYVENGTNLTTPKIELEGVYRGYDFNLSPLKTQLATLKQESVTKSTPDGPMAAAEFNVPFFDAENTININILAPSTNVVAHADLLNDCIDTTQIDWENEPIIRVVLKFWIDGTVSVEFPQWEAGTLFPEL